MVLIYAFIMKAFDNSSDIYIYIYIYIYIHKHKEKNFRNI